MLNFIIPLYCKHKLAGYFRNDDKKQVVKYSVIFGFGYYIIIIYIKFITVFSYF